jgi:hypothetical protein
MCFLSYLETEKKKNWLENRGQICLRKGKGMRVGKKGRMREVGMSKAQYIHVWKSQKEIH